MSIAAYAEPSVQIQLPSWIGRFIGARNRAAYDSNEAIERLYASMDAEYERMSFGPGRKRTPLREIRPV